MNIYKNYMKEQNEKEIPSVEKRKKDSYAATNRKVGNAAGEPPLPPLRVQKLSKSANLYK